MLSWGGEGAEIIYALRNSDALSRKIATEIEREGQIFRRFFQRRLPSDSSQDYYFIIRETKNNQSIIVEYGFLDNVADATRLKNNWQKYAEAVVRAITGYIGKNYVPPVGDISKPSIEDGIYIVVSGDSLWSIAKKFNTTVDAIKALNVLTSNSLSIGQALCIPGLYGDENQELDYVVYHVQNGDSLWAIANQHGITVQQIINFNRLTSTNLSVGQIIRIPKSVEIELDIEYVVHVVVAGDSLYQLAQRYNTTVQEIMTLNNLISSSLSIGQQLKIPRVLGENSSNVDVIHTVVAGDSLWSISQKHGISVTDLKIANALASDMLLVGQQLIIPRQKQNDVVTHIVIAGDNLYRLAQNFGISVDEIKKLNNLTSNNLSIGQKLLIPLN